MKAKECENCGSHEFHKVGNQWICDYCQTAYVMEEAAQPDPAPVVRKSSNRAYWLILLVLFLILVGVFMPQKSEKQPTVTVQLPSVPSFSQAESSSGSASDEKANQAIADWSKVLQQAGISKASGPSSASAALGLGKWTKSLYDSVKVAQSKYDSSSGQYRYSGGDNYDELVKKVGEPDRVAKEQDTSDGMPVRIRVDWDTKADGTAASQDLSITYIAQSKMIIDKSYDSY